MQASNTTCSSNLKQAAQQLLTQFAAPILAQETNASAATGKYQAASYAVSQDTFLYDHAKVSSIGATMMDNVCSQDETLLTTCHCKQYLRNQDEHCPIPAAFCCVNADAVVTAAAVSICW